MVVRGRLPTAAEFSYDPRGFVTMAVQSLFEHITVTDTWKLLFRSDMIGQFSAKMIIQKAKKEFASLPLCFGYSYKKLELEEVLNLIRESIKRYDLKFVVFLKIPMGIYLK